MSSAILSHILSSRVVESCRKSILRTDNRYGYEKEVKCLGLISVGVFVFSFLFSLLLLPLFSVDGKQLE